MVKFTTTKKLQAAGTPVSLSTKIGVFTLPWTEIYCCKRGPTIETKTAVVAAKETKIKKKTNENKTMAVKNSKGETDKPKNTIPTANRCWGSDSLPLVHQTKWVEKLGRTTITFFNPSWTNQADGWNLDTVACFKQSKF